MNLEQCTDTIAQNKDNENLANMSINYYRICIYISLLKCIPNIDYKIINIIFIWPISKKFKIIIKKKQEFK